MIKNVLKKFTPPIIWKLAKMVTSIIKKKQRTSCSFINNKNDKNIYLDCDIIYIPIIDEILKNITNQYDDNYDFYRFGVKDKGKHLKSRNIQFNIDQYRNSLEALLPYFTGIQNLYNILADDQSKQLLIKLIVYKIMGYEKYKLPLNTFEYWNGFKELEKYKSPSDYITAVFPGKQDYRLYKHDLTDINIPIKIYYSTSGIYAHLKIKQYEYINDNVTIKIAPDDIILDCGACWGDTALFFANELSEKGHVYSFEFIPNNIMVFHKNIETNANLKDKITLIPNPLDEFNNKKLYYIDNGPGSRVVSEPVAGYDIIFTINIDYFFEKYKLEKIDFIKMDIEGAELPALRGAVKTIRQFRPKLAISIYHSMDDFVNIAAYLHSLNLDYKFYLKHGTIHNEETVLLAIA